MDFQYYLKTQRKNCGGSLNRKLFTLRSYSHYLRLQEVDDAEKLPFHDVLKVRQGYLNRGLEQRLQQVSNGNVDTVLKNLEDENVKKPNQSPKKGLNFPVQAG